MGTKDTKIPGGFLIPTDFRWVDRDESQSVYTESTPRPGTSVPGDSIGRGIVEVVAAQGEDLSFELDRGGYPSRDGMGTRYTPASGTNSRGWDPAQVLAAVIEVNYVVSGTGVDRPSAATVPSTQKVLIAYRNTVASSVQIKVFDPATWECGAAVSVADTGTDWDYPGIVVLAGSERALLTWGGIVYYADGPDYDTWATYSTDGFADHTLTDYTTVRLAYHRGQIIGLIEGSGDLIHIASRDAGASWDVVETLTDWTWSATPLPCDGGLVVVGSYDLAVSGPSQRVVSIRIGGAYDLIASSIADAVNISASAAYSGTFAWADPDGTLWAGWLHDAWQSGLRLKVSYDAGLSWQTCTYSPIATPSTSSERTDRYLACAPFCGGVLAVAGISSATETVDSSLVGFVLGGWSTVTTGAPTSWLPHSRRGIGYDGTAGLTWWPCAKPGATGWTASGAGTETLATNAVLNIATSSNGRSFSLNLGVGASATWQYQTALNSGGSSTLDRVGVRVVQSDNVNEYGLTLRYTSSGTLLVRDSVSATTLTTWTFDTSIPHIVRGEITAGGYAVSYRFLGDTEWTTDTGALTADAATPAAQSSIEWGHISATGVSDSDWGHFTVYPRTTARPRFYSDDLSDPPFGRPVSTEGNPIADARDASDAYPYIRATGGSSRTGDTFTVAATADYPMSAAFVDGSPSPLVDWRGTGTDEIYIEFAVPFAEFRGTAFGLYVANTNVREWYLEYYNGATWTTVVYLDLAAPHEGLSYVKNERTIVADTGTATSRYLWEQELCSRGRNGVAIFDPSGSPVARPIEWQSAGTWTDATTMVARINYSGSTIAVPASGTVDLVHHTGLALGYPASVVVASRWRVRAPAGQPVAQGETYRAGLIMPGRYQPLGSLPDWGGEDEWTPRTSITRDRTGNPTAERLGETGRLVTVAFRDGATTHELHATDDLDYFGRAGATPAQSTHHDVGYHLVGIIEELQGGSIPCLLVRDASPSSSVTAATSTDPSRMIYGLITGAAVRITSASGDLGADELQRVDGITIEEIV